MKDGREIHQPRAADTCACVPDRLASRADVDDATSFYTYLKSIWQLYTRPSVHYPVAMESCNSKLITTMRTCPQNRFFISSPSKYRTAATHDCIWAGLRVTLHTLYFRFMVPQWVISILRPLISLVNFTLCESVSGFLCSLMSRMSSTSHINSITGCAL